MDRALEVRRDLAPAAVRGAAARTSPAAARALAWLAPLGAGAVLRLWNLHRQVLVDDELHTVLSSLHLTLGDILSSFKSEDPCLPLTAFFRVLLEAGMPFSELTYRLPVAAVSLATILVLPRAALPLVGARAALLFAWLLALSPVLALYGGMVRPYAVLALLAPAAVLALLRWRAGGGLGWGLGYAALAACGLWFHLGNAFLLAAPFVLLLAEKGVGRRAAPSWRDLAVVAAAGLCLVAAFVVPAWDSLRLLFEQKSGGGRFEWVAVPSILRLQAGTAASWLAAAFWASALGGAVVVRGRRPGSASLLLGPIAAQWVGLAVLAPVGLGNPVILNRYLIGTLPTLLLLAAVGLEAGAGRLAGVAGRRLAGVERRSPAARARLLAPVLFLMVLALAGPFADPEMLRTSFRFSKDFLRFDAPRGRLAEAEVPAFYRSELARGSGGAIAEFPFRGGWSQTRAHIVYQSFHRAPVIAIEPYEWTCDERLRLRNHHCPRLETLAAAPARFLVVHRNPLAEELAIEGGDGTGNSYRPAEWEEMRRIARRTARTLRRRWGPPAAAGGGILVWDLDAVRSRLAAR